MGLAWKRPPYKPKPSLKKGISKFFIAIKEQDIKIKMVILQYKMDFSRLKATALDNNNNNKDNIVIVLCSV